jgi:hypothetical protein
MTDIDPSLKASKTEAQLDFTAMTVISPDVILRGARKEQFSLEVPGGLDGLLDAWNSYNSCGGRIYIDRAGGILDHKSVTFREWLKIKGAKVIDSADQEVAYTITLAS